MNIALSHLSLNFLGGEEKLCLSFIEALKLTDHYVTLFTVEKTNWDSIQRFFGKIKKPDREIFITPLAIHANFAKMSTIVFSYANYLAGLIKLGSRRKYDLVISTYGDLFNSIADITYVHFPIRATVDYSQTPAFVSSLKWKLYCQAYNLSNLLLDNIRPSILLTNSKFTQQVIRKYLRRDALVLHPPVAVKTYANRNVKREDYVVTVSKFTPKRGLHRIPLIAQRTKNARFVIAGVADEYSSETIRNLRAAISNCSVEDRVTLMPNVPRSALIEILAKAKAYLHVMPFEHFGISIVEAMAAGCIPIVHRSGGPWLDMLDQRQGENGFSYTTLKEAAQTVDLVMADENLSKIVSSNAQKRAWHYDTSTFQTKLATIVDKSQNRGLS